MKSIYFNTAWLLLALLCVGITGCKKELEPIVAKGEPTYISLSTKTLNPGVAGSQINTVRVILINPAANHMIELNEFVGSPGTPLIIPVKTGTYDVYVVANEEADGSENTALSNVYNLSTLRAVNLPFLFNHSDLTNVPMFGEVKSVTITAPVSGVPSSTNLASVSIGGVDQGKKLPVELERMASKVSIKIVSEYTALNSATIERAPNAIPLFGNALLSTVEKQVKTIATNSFTSTTDPAGNILECKDILIPSWMFADATTISNAMLFRFTTPDGKSFSTELGHLISGATKDYRILRNHNYNLTILIINNMMTITAVVESWKEENLDIDNDNPIVSAP